MTTAREAILNGTHNLDGKTGSVHLDDLFDNFCDYAKKNFDYSSVKILGSEGSTILKTLKGTRKTVDCASLADAFVIMANEDLNLKVSKRVMVGSSAQSWATAANSKCFDVKIKGSIRPPKGQYAQIGRCVFSEHYFVQAGNAFYDPCMLTKYISKQQVQSWNLTTGWGKYCNQLYLIKEDPLHLLIRLPAPEKPPGFNSGMLLVETKDINKADYKAAFKKEKPGWQMKTKSMEELLATA